MTLARLTDEDRQIAAEILLKACDVELLEQALSAEDVYLGFQPELLSLNRKEKHKRLATLVIYLLGDGLLQSLLIRSALLSKKKDISTATWRPGSAAAVHICESLGLPAVFAGEQVLSYLPPAQRLISKIPITNLLDYQKEVFQNSLKYLEQGDSALLSLPTGGGKTLVATQILKSWHTKSRYVTSIWLAHTEELCEQAAQCIIQVWQSEESPMPAVLFRAWGRNSKKMVSGEYFQDAETNDPESSIHSIIVTTPQTAMRIFRSKITGSFGRAIAQLSLLIIDEAHRAAAPMYKDVIAVSSKQTKQQVALLGLSATPIRGTYTSRPYEGTQELARLFKRLVEPIETLGEKESPAEALRKRGVLSSLEIIKVGHVGMSTFELAKTISEIKRKQKEYTPALYFAENVSDAKVMATHLAELGHRAEYITSETSSAERTNLVESLRRGHVEILCNCEILTTGFDAPKVSEIYLARTTNSPVLYKQIIGRGLRGPRIGGSDKCRLYLCAISLPFESDPNTSQFARSIWNSN